MAAGDATVSVQNIDDFLCDDFNGSTSYVELDNTGGVIWDGASSVSISIWLMRIADNAAASAQWMIRHSGATNSRLNISSGSTSNTVAFNVGTSSSFGSTPIEVGKIYHAGLTYDADTDIATAFVNGQVTERVTRVPDGSFSSTLAIGALSSGSNQKFNGGLKGAKWWGRCLSDEEMKAESRSYNNDTGNTEGLVFHIPLGGDYTNNGGSYAGTITDNSIAPTMSLVLKRAMEALYSSQNDKWILRPIGSTKQVLLNHVEESGLG